MALETSANTTASRLRDTPCVLTDSGQIKTTDMSPFLLCLHRRRAEYPLDIVAFPNRLQVVQTTLLGRVCL